MNNGLKRARNYAGKLGHAHHEEVGEGISSKGLGESHRDGGGSRLGSSAVCASNNVTILTELPRL